uniref:Uncharacterized protein n=1 Tax=Anguilla anguilla TaxID=7936 RepID=A0A0E9XCB4_ANGAN
MQEMLNWMNGLSAPGRTVDAGTIWTVWGGLKWRGNVLLAVMTYLFIYYLQM